jgi:hypothetical protein
MLLSSLSLTLSAVFAPAAGAQEILPFPPTPSASTPGLTIQDSTYKKRVEPKRLADGAPNILIILMDDVGPGTPSTYGGEIHTPTLDRVSKMGVSFNRFHSTAMCSPTRAALLTGRNHTFVGNGQIAAAVTNAGTLAPGISSSIGTLTINNTLTLLSNSTNVFRVRQTGIATNDQVSGITTVTYGGKLKVTLTGTLVGGEVFKLFSATTYNPASFDSFDLPTIPSPLSWDTAQLTVDGTLRVSGTKSGSIGFAQIGNDANKNFQMSGTSVLPNWNYRVLATNIVDAPLSTWPQVGSGTFAGGVFSFVDLSSTNYPQRFYRVVAP